MEPMNILVGSCFFCLAPDAQFVLGGKVKWPRPIDPDASFRICEKCTAGLTLQRKAKAIWAYAKMLRKSQEMSN